MILLFIPSLGSGGAERQMAGLAELLSEHKYQVKLITWISCNKDNFYTTDFQKKGVEHLFLPKLANKYLRFFYLRQIIKKLAPKVIISFSTSSSIPLCLLKRNTRNRFKLIVSERSITVTTELRQRLTFCLYSYAEAIVCNSQWQSSYLSEKYPSYKTKIHTITNFVDLDRFKYKSRNESEFNSTKCIFVGRFTRAKNIPLFLKALKELSDKGYNFSVDFFGHSCEKEYALYCRKLKEKLGLDKIVSFNEPTLEIVKEYHKANLFCLPSTREGYPNVLCEAMSCGLPILASNISDIPSIMNEGVNGFLFNPESKNSIVSAFVKYFNKSTIERKNMSAESRRIAENKFSSDKFIQKYMTLIESLK